MKLAVIPARGGSKRIPQKNIKIFLGKPIIAWSIQAAVATNMFDRIVVSTDDEEISNVAQKFGAEVPFIRPDNLADDYTNTRSVVVHAINWHLAQGLEPEHICCIYATAPFLREEDIRNGEGLLTNSGADFVFSVTSFAFPIQRALKLNNEGRVEMFDPTRAETRSQDLVEAYHDAGQFYWGTKSAWISGTPIFGSGSIPFILPRNRVQDIDTPEDWQHAEALMKTFLN